MVVVIKCFTALIQLLTVRDNYDPGSCGESNHGELIVVKDRQNKDTILVCTEDQAVYTWKTTEGILLAVIFYKLESKTRSQSWHYL